MAVRMRIEQAVARAVAGASDAGDAYTRALHGDRRRARLAARGRLGARARRPGRAALRGDLGGRRGRAARVRADDARDRAALAARGCPGASGRPGRPTWVTDAATDERLPRRAAAAAAGMHAAVCFPVRSERGVVGVVEVFGPSPREPDADLLAALEVVGVQLGQLVERRRAEDSHHASEQRYRATLAGRAGLRRDDGPPRPRRRVQPGRRAHLRLHAATRRSAARWRS